MDFFNIDNIAVFGAAFLAMLSILAVGLPLIMRGEDRKRIDAVVDYRNQLIKEEREARNKGAHETLKEGGAEESISEFFKLKQIRGGTTIKDRLMQAGYRKPEHIKRFLFLRIIGPVIMVAIALYLMSLPEEPLSDSMVMLLSIGAALFGYALPGIIVKSQAQKRMEEIQLSFPDCIDLLLVCVQGGLSVEAAVQTVTRDIAPTSKVLAEEFGLLGAELSFLGDRPRALKNFAYRVQNPAARSFSNALVQAEKYGTPLGQALRVLSAEMRDKRFAAAEQKAASLPPKLTVPMIAFFMPTLFVVILGPAIIQAMSSMNSM